MGLLPLEFTDCLTDSPYFRDNLHAHEKELDRTSQSIKGLTKDVKELINAAKSMLITFVFLDCIYLFHVINVMYSPSTSCQRKGQDNIFFFYKKECIIMIMQLKKISFFSKTDVGFQ